MNKNRKLITMAVIFAIAVISVSVLAFKFSSLTKKIKLTKSGGETMAPQFSVKSINYPGTTLSLKKFRGKIILVNFWATWCPPCRAEIPRLEKFYRSYEKDGFVVIGLSVNNSGPAAVLNFIKTFKGGIITYPVGMATRVISKAYGNIYEIPQSFLINRKGAVVAHFTGELPPGFLNIEFNKINR